MKYMLLLYSAENRWSDEERTACMRECLGVCDDLIARGKFIATSPLQSVTTAATVRVRDGRPLITDGPFAETTEQLGGYFILDLHDLDEAIAVASRLPSVTKEKGAAEIRPMFTPDGVPPARPLPTGPSDPAVIPYLLLCYDDEAGRKTTAPAVIREAMAEALSLVQELKDAGQYLSASPLHPPATATCVRVRDGKRVITDGPFTETNEVLGGYYLILADSREAALRVAARHPGAKFGSVEVRPLYDFSGLRKVPEIS
ncbi:YciI family protein [Fimbriiglobus ruber]|uniref:DGPFAETKE domain protein n=1 Tax=Fimbriiglobus ruber TaxID=1908690 RepID=A0A225DK45_9BACT|nr:YciI family protein [Fimbriiglobus ruber]OWK37569.1 DGPFAETKE domain protein [Fimbriiglobus ruber]